MDATPTPGEVESEFQGEVSRLNMNSLIVDSSILRFSASTEIGSGIGISSLVKAEDSFRTDGFLMATGMNQ